MCALVKSTSHRYRQYVRIMPSTRCTPYLLSKDVARCCDIRLRVLVRVLVETESEGTITLWFTGAGARLTEVGVLPRAEHRVHISIPTGQAVGFFASLAISYTRTCFVYCCICTVQYLILDGFFAVTCCVYVRIIPVPYDRKKTESPPPTAHPTAPQPHRVPYATVCICLLYTSPSPRDKRQSRMPSSA